MSDPKVLLQKAQAQTKAGRYSFLLKELSKKSVNDIANGK